MYQELVKYPAGTKKETVLYILLIVLGVFLVSILSWFLSEVTGQGWMEFLAFAVLVLWAFRIYSKRIVEYRYSLMDTELIIARKVGSREKNIFTLENILALAHRSLYAADAPSETGADHLSDRWPG